MRPKVRGFHGTLSHSKSQLSLTSSSNFIFFVPFPWSLVFLRLPFCCSPTLGSTRPWTFLFDFWRVLEALGNAKVVFMVFDRFVTQTCPDEFFCVAATRPLQQSTKRSGANGETYELYTVFELPPKIRPPFSAAVFAGVLSRLTRSRDARRCPCRQEDPRRRLRSCQHCLRVLGPAGQPAVAAAPGPPADLAAYSRQQRNHKRSQNQFINNEH